VEMGDLELHFDGDLAKVKNLTVCFWRWKCSDHHGEMCVQAVLKKVYDANVTV
jgi:hypothetical protein